MAITNNPYATDPIKAIKIPEVENLNHYKILYGNKSDYETIVLNIFLKCAKYVKINHDQGMVHRSITPESVSVQRTINGLILSFSEFGVVSSKHTSAKEADIEALGKVLRSSQNKPYGMPLPAYESNCLLISDMLGTFGKERPTIDEVITRTEKILDLLTINELSSEESE